MQAFAMATACGLRPADVPAFFGRCPAEERRFFSLIRGAYDRLKRGRGSPPRPISPREPLPARLFEGVGGESSRSSLRGRSGCAVLAGSGVGILEARAIFLMSPCYEMPKTPILSAPSRACGGILLRDVICMW